jgi:hypothetical protein
LGKKVKKPMDLAIPMGKHDHSKEVAKMVKRLEKLYAQAKKLLEKPESDMKNMLTK